MAALQDVTAGICCVLCNLPSLATGCSVQKRDATFKTTHCVHVIFQIHGWSHVVQIVFLLSSRSPWDEFNPLTQVVQNVASSFVNRPAAVGLSLRSVRVRAKSLGVSGDGILTSKSQSVSESLTFCRLLGTSLQRVRAGRLSLLLMIFLGWGCSFPDLSPTSDLLVYLNTQTVLEGNVRNWFSVPG